MPKSWKTSDGRIMFYCQGCDCHHAVNDSWSFNGDFENPTFSPSILVRSGHYSDSYKGDCWCTYNEKHPDNPSTFKCIRCHSFVRDGKIEYLSDCTHELAGKTVELEDIEKD
jgi:hypothetical protein